MEDQLKLIKKDIEDAAHKVGRNPKEVTLIAVSKTYPVEAIKQAYDLGCRDFGENKVQELLGKIEVLDPCIRWHFIGHLQTNKVKYIIGKVELIHSVDSLKLLEEINKQSSKKNTVTNVLIQVNVAKEESKYGFEASKLKEILPKIAELKYVHVKGIMTIAPYVDNSEENRYVFRELSNILVDMQKQNIDNISTNILSMGMSNDYSVAIEEGSTMIRVGTALFGERDYS